MRTLVLKRASSPRSGLLARNNYRFARDPFPILFLLSQDLFRFSKLVKTIGLTGMPLQSDVRQQIQFLKGLTRVSGTSRLVCAYHES